MNWHGQCLLLNSLRLISCLWGYAAAAETREVVLPTLPDYLVTYQDSVSGLDFTRITKPGKLGADVKCGPKYCSHRYSSAQAWNWDQSLLVIANGCGGFCFFDGRNYTPLFQRSQSMECEWLPHHPERMICVGGKKITLWSPRSDTSEILYTSDDYTDLHLGPGKGNPSNNGERLTVRAETNGATVAFAFDIPSQTKFPDIRLDALPGENSYCTISPLGEKSVCFQSQEIGSLFTYVFDLNGELLQEWREDHRPGHGDLAVDVDGSEIIVGVSKSTPDKYHVIKRRLDDGKVTVLAPYGEATHVSLRSISKNKWATVSYEGDPVEVGRHPKWSQHSRQIVLVALDGSGTSHVIADTKNEKSDYYSETHGSISPDGSQVIWSSNWGRKGGPVYDFVTQLQPTTLTENQN